MNRMPHTDKRKIMAIDPGGTTGIAYLQNRKVVGREEIGPNGTNTPQHRDTCHEMLLKAINSFNPDYILFEQFDYRPHMDHADLISCEYIGIFKLWSIQNDKPWVAQPSRVGKVTSKTVFWNARKLKAVGLWLPNMGHAMDATSHLLYHWTSTLKQDDYKLLLRNLGDVA